MTDEARAVLVERLTKAQRKFLRTLSPEEGHYQQVRYEEVGLSFKGYRELRDLKIIEEAWVWTSRTRPAVTLTDLGRKVLTESE